MPFEELNAARVRIEIAGISTPIWRRLIVPLSWNLHQLRHVIQAAFNWWNYHLHEFRSADCVTAISKSKATAGRIWMPVCSISVKLGWRIFLDADLLRRELMLQHLDLDPGIGEGARRIEPRCHRLWAH